MRRIPLVALLVAGCVTAEPTPAPPPAGLPPPPPARVPPPPSAPPPGPALISEAEAVRIAANFARSRGLVVQRYRAKLDANQRWQVDLKAQQGEDRARVLIDARDGKLLRAKLRHTKNEDEWDNLE